MMPLLKSSVVFVCVFALLSSGCVTTAPKNDQEIVAGRAQERLTALVEKDFEKAYSFSTPSYRNSVSLKNFMPKYAGAKTWVDADVAEVDCISDSVCDVKTSISYRLVRLSNNVNTRVMEERWIKVDGKWWIYLK